MHKHSTKVYDLINSGVVIVFVVLSEKEKKVVHWQSLTIMSVMS